MLPLRGISLLATDGQPFHDAAADEALFEALRANVNSSRIEVREFELDINHPEFALAMADRLHEFYEEWKGT
jgi:uncharacterized protein (UPF0261 family)